MTGRERNIALMRHGLVQQILVEYDLDYPDSDNEDLAYMGRPKQPSFEASNKFLDMDFEILLCSVTYSNLDWKDRDREDGDTDILRGGNCDAFLKHFITENRQAMGILPEDCDNVTKFSDYMKCILYLEAHFSVLKEFHAKFTLLRQRGPGALRQIKRDMEPSFLKIHADKVEKSTLLIDFKGSSTQPGMNKRLFE